MLMRSFDVGGIPVYRDHIRDERAVREQTSHNPHGFYEPPMSTLLHPSWPYNVPDGHALKMWPSSVGYLDQTEPFRVALLYRDPLDINASSAALMGRPSSVNPQEYQVLMADSLSVLRKMNAVRSVTELAYEAIMENPAEELSKLVTDGWPLDLVAAAEVPDLSLRHHGDVTPT